MNFNLIILNSISLVALGFKPFDVRKPFIFVSRITLETQTEGLQPILLLQLAYVLGGSQK